MHLTLANLAYFLMDRGLIGADEIVAGRISVVDASRRNRNFKVIRTGASGLFVKQMRYADRRHVDAQARSRLL
jgi:hypothetical protein